MRGEVFIRLVAGQADWVEQASGLLLVAPSGDRVPVQFDSVRPHKDGLIAKFREVPGRDGAEAICRHKVYVAKSALASKPGERIFLYEIEGFVLREARLDKVVGRITGFATNGPQDLLRVDCGKREALVPFIDAFLVNIDFDKKEVTMDLPEGLLDVEDR
jgi:16S rRNA processing protein RimM